MCVFVLITTRDKQQREACPCRVSRHFLSCSYLASVFAQINWVVKQMSVNENRTEVLDETVPSLSDDRDGQAYSAGHTLTLQLNLAASICASSHLPGHW